MTKFHRSAQRKNTSCYKWDAHSGTIPFGVADSDYPVAQPIINELRRRINTGAFGYSVYPIAYDEIVANWCRTQYGYNVSCEQISHAAGVVYAINFLIQALTNVGDGIIIQPPVYNCFEMVISQNKRTTLNNHLIRCGDTFEIDFANLEELLKNGAKMLLFCSPANPTGNVWSKEVVEKVLTLCKKYNCIVVSDEIHCDLIFFGNKFTSAGHYLSQLDNLIICTAPSKTFNLAGFFTSNIIFANPSHKQAFDYLREITCTNHPDALGVVATMTAYTKCAKWMKEQNKYIEKNYLYLKQFLQDNLPEAKLCELQGTYLAFVDLTYLGLTDAQLEQRFTNCGVSANFGKMYGERYEGFVRLNLACPLSQLKKGLALISKAVE